MQPLQAGEVAAGQAVGNNREQGNDNCADKYDPGNKLVLWQECRPEILLNLQGFKPGQEFIQIEVVVFCLVQ